MSGGDHAAGEWRIETVENYQGFPALVGALIVTDSVIVAEVRGAVLIDGDVSPENYANAHLIAAAPDLLAATRDLIALASAYAPETADGPIVSYALLAVAKATGADI